MFAGLGILLLVVPIVELYVLIQVGQEIGTGLTILLLIGVSIAGTMLLKREGVATWRRLQESLRAGRMPTDEVTDGALIMLGGALLLTPGFVTDAFGLLLLFPGTRAGAKVFFRKALGIALFKRFPGAATAATAGRKVYDASVTRSRRVDGITKPRVGHADTGLATGPVKPVRITPEQLPYEQRGPSGEDGSPGTKA